MIMFTCGTHKTVMAPVLHFDKNLVGKKSSLLVMTQSEKKLDEVVKGTNFLCSVVIKGSTSLVKEETTILEEMLGILENF